MRPFHSGWLQAELYPHKTHPHSEIYLHRPDNQAPPVPYTLRPPPQGDGLTGRLYVPQVTSVRLNFPELSAVVESSSGFVNSSPDLDFVDRRLHLARQLRQRLYPSFDVQILRRFLDVAPEGMALYYDYPAVRKIQLGNLEIPTDRESGVLINYRSGRSGFPVVSAADLLADRASPGIFQGKIVLIGTAAIGIGDIHATPLGLTPGVEIHAHLLDTLLTGRQIRSSALVDCGWILLFGMGVPVLLALLPRRRLWTTTGAAWLLFVAICYAAMTWNYWVNMTVPTSVLVAGLLVAIPRDPSDRR